LQREIDVVDIFRRAEDVPEIIDQAIGLHQAFLTDPNLSGKH
jgi:predicted CoA-binding protein